MPPNALPARDSLVRLELAAWHWCCSLGGWYPTEEAADDSGENGALEAPERRSRATPSRIWRGHPRPGEPRQFHAARPHSGLADHLPPARPHPGEDTAADSLSEPGCLAPGCSQDCGRGGSLTSVQSSIPSTVGGDELTVVSVRPLLGENHTNSVGPPGAAPC